MQPLSLTSMEDALSRPSDVADAVRQWGEKQTASPWPPSPLPGLVRHLQEHRAALCGIVLYHTGFCVWTKTSEARLRSYQAMYRRNSSDAVYLWYQNRQLREVTGSEFAESLGVLPCADETEGQRLWQQSNECRPAPGARGRGKP